MICPPSLSRQWQSGVDEGGIEFCNNRRKSAVAERSELENVELGGLAHRHVDSKGPHDNLNQPLINLD